MIRGEKISFAMYTPGDPETFDISSGPVHHGDIRTIVKTRDRIPEEAGVLCVRHSICKWEHDHMGDASIPVIDYVRRTMVRKIADTLMDFCEITKVENRFSDQVVYELSIALADLGQLPRKIQNAEYEGVRKGRNSVLSTLPTRVDDFGNVISR